MSRRVTPRREKRQRVGDSPAREASTADSRRFPQCRMIAKAFAVTVRVEVALAARSWGRFTTRPGWLGDSCVAHLVASATRRSYTRS